MFLFSENGSYLERRKKKKRKKEWEQEFRGPPSRLSLASPSIGVMKSSAIYVIRSGLKHIERHRPLIPASRGYRLSLYQQTMNRRLHPTQYLHTHSYLRTYSSIYPYGQIYIHKCMCVNISGESQREHLHNQVGMRRTGRSWWDRVVYTKHTRSREKYLPIERKTTGLTHWIQKTATARYLHPRMRYTEM